MKCSNTNLRSDHWWADLVAIWAVDGRFKLLTQTRCCRQSQSSLLVMDVATSDLNISAAFKDHLSHSNALDTRADTVYSKAHSINTLFASICGFVALFILIWCMRYKTPSHFKAYSQLLAIGVCEDAYALVINAICIVVSKSHVHYRITNVLSEAEKLATSGFSRSTVQPHILTPQNSVLYSFSGSYRPVHTVPQFFYNLDTVTTWLKSKLHVCLNKHLSHNPNIPAITCRQHASSSQQLSQRYS